MRWSIRNQILIPFACLQGLAIAVISVIAAWSAVSRAERETMSRLDQVVVTLSSASFPVRGTVLEQMKGLSGAEFIAVRGETEIVASTLDPAKAAAILDRPRAASSGTGRLNEFQAVTVDEESFLASGVKVMRSPELSELVVLVPERQWRTIREDVLYPPLMIGGLTMLSTVALSYVLAARFGRRLDRMQHHVGQLASLKFDQLLPISGNDELTRLATSINSMAVDLHDATEQMKIAERTTLITQVAGGLAHQLRNSMTGAKMAVQLHLRRCSHPDQESLQVALRQLNLTESQIRGLLSLTQETQRTPVPGGLKIIVGEIRDLLEPQFQHSNSRLLIEWPTGAVPFELQVSDAEQVQAAILNLVQNALEACRPDGVVKVLITTPNSMIMVEVLDNGPGVSDDLRERIFDPFVTGKPEGVGLGLTLAAQVAETCGGRLTFERRDGWTVFQFLIQAERG